MVSKVQLHASCILPSFLLNPLEQTEKTKYNINPTSQNKHTPLELPLALMADMGIISKTEILFLTFNN